MRRAIIIETDAVDPATPVSGCGCDECPATVADVAEIDGCALTPGDASPVGRCPSCDGLVYIDTPASRAEDAFRDLLRIKTWHPEEAAKRVAALESAFNEAMAGAYIRAEMLLVRGTYNVVFEDADGDEFRYPVMANDVTEAVAVAWGVRRADEFDIRPGVEGFDPKWALEGYPENYNVDSVFPFAGGADESAVLRELAKTDFGDPIALDDVLKALPPFDDAQARAEGWTLATEDLAGTFRINAVGDTFASHNAALFHVVQLAQSESPYHARALALIGVENTRHE